MSGLVNEEKLKQMGAQPPLGDSNSEDGALVITAWLSKSFDPSVLNCEDI